VSDASRKRGWFERAALGALSLAEHVVFIFVGVLLFLVALALLVHTAATAVPMFEPNNNVVDIGTSVLDRVLLVLMVVELAYTVLLSLRGGGLLSAEAFLLVGLIAVVRRILVITVGEPRTGGTAHAASSATLLELGVLTGVVLAFVASIFLLRLRPRMRPIEHNGADQPGGAAAKP
jgi:uncharacterized membrane protein (DUF373 family)